MLKLKRLGIDTQSESVAFLNRRCPLYRAEGFQALSKIEVAQDGRRIVATLNLVDDDALLGLDELGLSEQAFALLGLPPRTGVQVAQAAPPASLEAVKAKIQGATLAASDFDAIISDIAAHRYSKMEIAAFLIASASFLTTDEILALTQAMARAGTQLAWGRGPVVDKHCVGGIPGNRTSMIVVPIVAAHGLVIPKTSSRAITSPAGTADTMEVLAAVDLPLSAIRATVDDANGCLVWGGNVNLSPADDILISVERPLAIDTPEQMVASILSKKLAAGSTHLVIDIPVGPTAKVRDRAAAVRLKKLFEHIGGRLGLMLDVVLTDGAQPIGDGIGPLLEARDVMAVLRNEPHAPADLKAKAVMLAGRVIDFDPAVRGGEGERIAREILESGRALAQMEKIRALQGPPPVRIEPGGRRHVVTAPHAGAVREIDNLRLARIARLAGAPMDKGAGIDLHAKLGTAVMQGAPLYTIYAHHPADFGFAVEMALSAPGYVIA